MYRAYPHLKILRRAALAFTGLKRSALFERPAFGCAQGFTLAELLIALAILGVIATFSIPKILQSQQDGRFNAASKEAMAAVAGVYKQAQLGGTVSGASKFSDMTQSLNYVKIDTGAQIDDVPGWGFLTCSAATPCYKLHNGSLLMAYCGFAGTSTTDAMVFHFDPDGSYSGSTTGTGKSLQFLQYYNGRVTVRGVESANVNSSCGSWLPASMADVPSWFSY